MKIVFFEMNSRERSFFEIKFKDIPDLEVLYFEEKFNEENTEVLRDAEVLSVFVNSEIKKEQIQKMPNLKLISTRSTGYDHIDVSFAKERGIRVANIPSYGSNTVAEFTFALILSLSRKIYPAYNQLREGTNFDISQLRGFDLHGKTLGVIGMGRIGRNVIKIARGFGMNVLVNDIRPDLKFADEHCAKCVSLDEVLSGSDIVTIHTFYSKETFHLLNRENIFKMKKGSYLINTARGEIVETEALLEAITVGHLSGAGLDVLEAERQLKEEVELIKGREEKIKDFKTLYENHVLIDLPQVVVTPHIAFCTKEAEEEILKVSADTIISFKEGEEKNLV